MPPGQRALGQLFGVGGALGLFGFVAAGDLVAPGCFVVAVCSLPLFVVAFLLFILGCPGWDGLLAIKSEITSYKPVICGC